MLERSSADLYIKEKTVNYNCHCYIDNYFVLYLTIFINICRIFSFRSQEFKSRKACSS